MRAPWGPGEGPAAPLPPALTQLQDVRVREGAVGVGAAQQQDAAGPGGQQEAAGPHAPAGPRTARPQPVPAGRRR